MKIWKVMFLASVSTGVKIISGLIINKCISLFVGPSGLAMIGQLQNASGIIQTFSSAGLANGVVKYTAENVNRASLWGTAFRITFFFSIFSSIILVCFSSYLSESFLGGEDYAYVFIVFGCTISLFSINQLLLSIINGLKKIRLYISLNVIQSVYSLIFTVLLIYFFKLDGALIAMVTNQSVVFFILVFMLRKDKDISILNIFSLPTDLLYVKKLFQYSLMAIVSAVCLPMSSLFIRNYIATQFSWEFAGYWQAASYISSMYLLVVSTVLTIYYLPRLSSALDKTEMYKELKNNALVLLPVTILIAFTIFLLRDWIVVLLFSEKFRGMLILLEFQLLGDIVKVSACLLSYFMLAKAMTKTFILTEIFSAINITWLSISLSKYYGFVGLSYAYLINSVIYLLIMIFVVFFYLKRA
jgi:PST family polysaccharide transporter